MNFTNCKGILALEGFKIVYREKILGGEIAEMKIVNERKYYDNPKDNAAFVRCVDLLAGLIEKYADVVLGKVERFRCDYKVVKEKAA